MRTALAPFLVLVLFTGGCVTSKTQLSIDRYELAAKTWEGGQLADMIDAWGIPSEVYDLSELQGIGRMVVVWNTGEHLVQTRTPPAARRTLSCTGETKTAGFSDKTETECVEGDTSAADREAAAGHYLGLAISDAFDPPRMCKLSVHVRDGVIHRVNVENIGCRLSEVEYAELAMPGSAGEMAASPQ